MSRQQNFERRLTELAMRLDRVEEDLEQTKTGARWLTDTVAAMGEQLRTLGQRVRRLEGRS